MGVAPVPTNLDEYLNDQQQLGLREVQKQGWHVKFVRRPGFHPPTVVLAYRNGRKLGLLEQDGHLDQDAEIHLRSPARFNVVEPVAGKAQAGKYLV